MSIALVASSKALRLKPYGIFVEVKIDPSNWFLNPKDDVLIQLTRCCIRSTIT
jgi:hypothetical protein